MKICGIDPGIRGGLAIVMVNDSAAPQLIDVLDVPVIGTGAKERVNTMLVRDWLAQHKPDHALIERAGSMPRQGIASTFKYARAVGSLETVVACSDIAYSLVQPNIWKKVFGLRGKDKESARQKAIAIFPAAHALFARKKDHQRLPGRRITKRRSGSPRNHTDTRNDPVKGRLGRGVSRMNAFLEFAEKQTPASVKARQRAAEKRRTTESKKALAERDDLFRLWKRWRRERLETLLAGPHGDAARELVAFLQAMTLDDGARLVEFVRAAGWERTDADTKFEILSLINATITALRERAKLPPINDALPDEEPTAFLIIREMFR